MTAETDGAAPASDDGPAAVAHAQTLVDSGLDAPPLEQEGPAVGMRLGHYHVLRRLGAGAMGTVVEAHDETLDRRVAIKLLHERRDPRQEKRLLREAQALARLSHPHVVQVYEVGEAAGHVFIAMELVNGRTLQSWQEQPRPWREVVDVYLQAGRGLAAAHAEGLIHRDFKPGNAIIDEQGRVRVLDFGLARESTAIDELDTSRPEQDPAALLLTSGSGTNRALAEVLTRTGAVLGTPAYMAPEQLSGKGGSALSDQFGFCVALYEGLYRRRPFPLGSIGELVTAVLGGEVQPPPSGRRVPRALWPVVRRGLSRRPEDRFATMDELLASLEAIVRPRSAARWLAVSGLAAATAFGLWFGTQPEGTPPCRDAPARLDGVWDEAQASTVDEALRASELPYAETTSRRVRAQLDEYAQRWIAVHTEACEATEVHHRQSPQVLDLRMHCLDERRRALDRTADLLASADASMVEHAVAIASGLPRLDRCNDTAALQAELPPPEDPEMAAEVDALREQLVRVRVLAKAERLEETEREAHEVLERSLALEYLPLVAEARLERGAILEQLGRYPEAVEQLEAAFSLAAEIGHEHPASMAAISLSSVTGRHQARLEVGRTWGIAGEALARRVEPEGPLHALALRTAAIVEISDGRAEEAEQRFEHALKIWEEHPDPPGLALARALGDVGNLRQMQGQLDEALTLYRRADALRVEELGEGHPSLATGAINIGRVHEQRGALTEAEAEYRRALELWRHSRAPDHPDVAIALNNLAVALDKQGRPEDALPLYQRVLEAREARLGREHPYVGQTLVNMGLALRAQGKLDESHARIREGLELFEAAGSPDVSHALVELGETELAMERWVDAERDLDRARVLLLEISSGDLGLVSGLDLQRTRAKWGRGEHEAARELARDLLRRTKATEGTDPKLVSAVESWLEEHPAEESSSGRSVSP